MRKQGLLITGIVFLLIGMAVVILKGSSYTLKVDTHSLSDDADQYQVSIAQNREIVKVTDRKLKDGILSLTVQSVSMGKAFLDISGPEEYLLSEVVYVHRFGILTVNSYFGRSSGAAVIPVLVTLYMALILWYVIAMYRKGMQVSLYQYSNIRNLGWILFLVLMLVGQIPYLFSGNSLMGAVSSTLRSASNVAVFAFPVAFIVSILVAISNVQLMRREGRNWRNMLGTALGILVCLGTLLPNALSAFLQQTKIVDVHNERGIALYVEMAVTNIVLVTVSYLECILWGTILLAVKAARKIPAFDKDYILILGCQIKKDGSLTPLLKGRTDCALKFARMQKEASGKDVVFVPSGGKGSDEIIAEAQAIRNYLADTGMPDERILVEAGSANTYENFKNSMALIRKNSPAAKPKVAFSTTNYHVFRSGIFARQQGIDAEGIGSRTYSYFWINASVREFIATVYAERKKHLRVIVALAALTLILVSVVRMSNIL